METAKTIGKVAIIGTGIVGSTAAFAIAIKGIAAELVLIDANKNKAKGEALDTGHALSFAGQMIVYDGDYDSVKDADVIIITAGTARGPNETRLDLAKRNTGIIKNIVENVMKHYNGGIILMITNPVDVLTYIAQKMSGLPAGKIFGSGTILDSIRLNYLICRQCGANARNVHGYILGEHGDSQVIAWNSVNIDGMKLDEYLKNFKDGNVSFNKAEIKEQVKNSGATVIQMKGATNYGIAECISKIVEAVLKNQNSIFTTSTVLNGHYGISNVALSLPTVININGIDRVLDIDLNEKEIKELQESAKKIKEIIDLVEQ